MCSDSSRFGLTDSRGSCAPICSKVISQFEYQLFVPQKQNPGSCSPAHE